MNLNDLNNLRYLDSEIKEYRKAIAECSGRSEYERMLAAKTSELIRKKQEAFAFISSIEDSQTRQIIFLRYIKGMSWGQVAIKIGGGNTDDGVRKRAVRYIKSATSETEEVD